MEARPVNISYMSNHFKFLQGLTDNAKVPDPGESSQQIVKQNN